MKGATTSVIAPTIVIVEDTESCGSTLEIALSSLTGFVAILITKGDKALRYLENQENGKVCAVVTDLHMPGMDGFELIQRIRADRRYINLPIIVVSGSTDPRTPGRVFELGANAFFGKPYSPAKVRAKLEQLLNGNQSKPYD
jgi:DNA-binding response OmpR family regulator